MRAFFTYTMMFIMSFFIIGMLSVMLPRAGVAADRIKEVIDTESTICDKPDCKKLEAVKGVVRYEHVSFAYPGADEDVLTDLDFEARYKSKAGNEIDVLGDNFNKMSSQLEHTISELKSANNELQKDIENKVKIDEMRKEFLDNVSHELKTPIALVQGYAEGLKENINDDPESMDFYCDVIIDEASKMNKLVKNLLTLNQLESGKDAAVMERFDLTALIKGVLSTMDIMIRQKEARVIFNETEPLYVWADEFKTEEVDRKSVV